MNYNLQIKKGSSGYSAPGPSGIAGKSGKSSHFSAIPIDSSVLLAQRISNSQSLTDNERYIEEENYEVGDIIVDLYANLGIIMSKDPVGIEGYGNIMFYEDPVEEAYRAPVDSSGLAVLNFKMIKGSGSPRTPEEDDPGDIGSDENDSGNENEEEWEDEELEDEELEDENEEGEEEEGEEEEGEEEEDVEDDGSRQGVSISDYRIHQGITNPDSKSPMWHHRWQDSSIETAPATLLFASTDNDLSYCGSPTSTSGFIRTIIEKEKYCKIVAVFKNGLTYELSGSDMINAGNISGNPRDSSIDTSLYIPIFDGYFYMIDRNISGIKDCPTFDRERRQDKRYEHIGDASIASFFSDENLCDLYFEYSHENKIYRMKINVIYDEN